MPLLGNATGLKNRKAIDAAVKAYCDHLAKGQPKQFFYYRDKKGSHCDHDTLEKTIKREKLKLAPILIKEAELTGLQAIYKLGMRMIKGGKDVLNTSPKTWEIVMRNKGRKHGWDPKDSAEEDKNLVLNITNYGKSACTSE